VTSIQILENLAKDFSCSAEHVRSALEMIDAGLTAPFIGRVRRAESGGMSESQVRHLDRTRKELEELDRRRGTILRLLEGVDSVTAQDLEQVKACMDRFELEDLFVPHRRPEPEVQLGLDRGLGKLAVLLVAPQPREQSEPKSEPAPQEAVGDGADPEPHPEPEDAPAVEQDTAQAAASAPGSETSAASGEDDSPAESAPVQANEPEVERVEPVERDEQPADETTRAQAGAPMHDKVDLTPELARVCAPFVNPDKGIHTDMEALEGAMRILSDRLGRNARLRGTIRRLFRKNGVLSVRATVDESRLGRHRSLLKIRQPLRQLQGHRLLTIRQAQKERVVTTVVTLDPKLALPKVRAALGKYPRPEFASVLDVVARRALDRRLLPVADADVRLELKERADEEALRFLAQHLRQVLLAPPLGPFPVVGIDVSAKGDWTVSAINGRGEPVGVPQVVEVADKDAEALGAEFKAALETIGASDTKSIAIGHGKLARAGLLRFRPALAAAGMGAHAFIINDSGLASYANSELARRELPGLSVPQRMATSIARRLRDPMDETLKVDPRHLGLGSEQGLVSKANIRRMFDEVIESCVALVGCDVNAASQAFLKHLPGIGADTAKKLIERRAEKPFESREELRAEGLLSEAQWISAISSMRVSGSKEPLDATSLHPQQYDLARRVIESTGGSVEDTLRRPGATKGLRRVDFDVDEHTWRDLMREISHPGRDVRHRLFAPKLLDPACDPVTLVPGRVLEGTVSNVASFGAFVDLGLAQDGLVHISEISSRYVRDARELLSIGQTVRVRLTEGSSQRLALSLKNVPEPDRPSRPRAEGRGRGRGARKEFSREPLAPVRAARSRRDGLVPGLGEGERRGGPGRGGRGRTGAGAGAGGGGWSGGGGGRGRRRDRDSGDEPFRAEDLGPQKTQYNPFATFFKGNKPDKGSEGQEQEQESAEEK
jgi:uncharacterized protein